LLDLDSAFYRFFTKVSSYPAFKRKGNGGSFSVLQHFSIEGNRLTIPKFKTPIRFFKHREIEGTVRSLTITKEPSGKCNLAVLAPVDTEKENEPPKEIKPVTLLGTGMFNRTTVRMPMYDGWFFIIPGQCSDRMVNMVI